MIGEPKHDRSAFSDHPAINFKNRNFAFSHLSESGPKKQGIPNPSSESSGESSSVTNQDPLSWFHNKYGVGSPSKTTTPAAASANFSRSAYATTPNASTRVNVGRDASLRRVKEDDDDDDDIFDGLDDDTQLSRSTINSSPRRQQSAL